MQRLCPLRLASPRLAQTDHAAQTYSEVADGCFCGRGANQKRTAATANAPQRVAPLAERAQTPLTQKSSELHNKTRFVPPCGACNWRCGRSKHAPPIIPNVSFVYVRASPQPTVTRLFVRQHVSARLTYREHFAPQKTADRGRRTNKGGSAEQGKVCGARRRAARPFHPSRVKIPAANSRDIVLALYKL